MRFPVRNPLPWNLGTPGPLRINVLYTCEDRDRAERVAQEAE